MTTRVEWMEAAKKEPTKYSGHFKMSYNPTALLIKEIQKKIRKTAWHEGFFYYLRITFEWKGNIYTLPYWEIRKIYWKVFDSLKFLF